MPTIESGMPKNDAVGVEVFEGDISTVEQLEKGDVKPMRLRRKRAARRLKQAANVEITSKLKRTEGEKNEDHITVQGKGGMTGGKEEIGSMAECDQILVVREREEPAVVVKTGKGVSWAERSVGTSTTGKGGKGGSRARASVPS